MKISVVIPVYNVAPYLRECLDSVCAAVQELECRVGAGERTGHPLVEVICVDDGSTDGSGELLDELVGEMSGSGTAELQSSVPLSDSNSSLQLKVIHQQNAGVSAARNAALNIATGEWILFVDADDVISPRTMEVCWNAVERFGDIDLVWFRHVVFPQDGRPVGLADGASVVTVTRVDMTRHIDGGIADSAMPFVAVSYRRNLLGEIRFEVGRRYGEDRIFMADFLQRCSRIAVADAVCYGYRQRADSAVHIPQTGCILREELTCWIACCERLLADHREVDASCLRRWAQVLTETFARRYYWLPSVERRGLLDFWRREMECLDGLLFRFPFWARNVMRLLRRVPVSPLFWLLCFFPDFLKRKGFHR